jgi:lycopene cyclase domain-containing protein
MTYAGLALVFLAGGLAVAVVAHLSGLPRGWWSATALVAVVLFVLTAAFDSMMIAADLFRYDTGSLTGLRVFLVPVEDFAWPLVAVLVLPALWELLGHATQKTRQAPEAQDTQATQKGGRHRER